ncbi:MAG: hypothetical protein ACLS36_03795 [Streptococcus sp.]
MSSQYQMEYWNKHGMTMDNGAKAVADQSASTVGEVGQILSKVF